ncbi:hypothetical protein H100_00942 [Trichophyton rubrum MR850]|nr:hypothetical protein H100_00942 [Trichophyton rubrum MR850]
MLRDPKFAAKPVHDRSQGQKRKTTQTRSSESRLRLACNRCHTQKLRCLRSDGTEPGSKCERCRRASVQCVYSPPDRIGRPARSGVSSTTSAGGSSKSDGGISPRNAPRRSSASSPLPSSPEPLFSPRQGAAIGLPCDDARMFDFHIDESSIKVDMLSFYNDHMPFPESSVALLTEKPIMQDVTSQNITISPYTKKTSEVPRVQRSTTEMAPDNYVRELMAFGLAQYDQLRFLQRMRNCIGDDKKGVFSRLRNFPIHGMLEQVRRLTELIRQLMPISDSNDGCLRIICSEFVSESIPDIDSCLFNEQAIMNDCSDMLAHPFSDLSYFSSSDSTSLLSPLTPSKQPPVDTSTILLFPATFVLREHSPCSSRTSRPFSFSQAPLIPLPLVNSEYFQDSNWALFNPIERMLCRLHDSLGLSWNQCNSESLPNSQMSADAGSNADAITRAMMKTIQTQERIDAQDERGDTFTRLLLIMENVKRLVKTQPFL